MTRYFFVGNVIVDSLEFLRRLWASSASLEQLDLNKGQYGVVTLHRPSNGDNVQTLEGPHGSTECGRTTPSPCLPRPSSHDRRAQVAATLSFMPPLRKRPGSDERGSLYEPCGNLDFMALVAGARIVLTDSGGLQEETTVLVVPLPYP